MTLIVSARTIDGIVIAGDSLSTLMGNRSIAGDVDVTCPSCNHQHVFQATLQGPALPATTLAYAQKIFPFMADYGIGTFGGGQVGGRTIYFAVRELEQEIYAKPETEWPDTATEAARLIGDRIFDLLKQEALATNFDLDTWPDDFLHIGLQIAGYNGELPVTCGVSIGKTVKIDEYFGLDVTITGVMDVFNALNGVYQANPQATPMIEFFSLQDAIAYSQFLIKTTALHQQFSRVIPSVGGDIDVGVITPFGGFGWVAQKPLFAKLAEEEAKNNEAQS